MDRVDTHLRHARARSLLAVSLPCARGGQRGPLVSGVHLGRRRGFGRLGAFRHIFRPGNKIGSTCATDLSESIRITATTGTTGTSSSRRKIGKIDEPIFHSGYFTLVDRQGRIRGYYDGTDQKKLAQLFKDIAAVLKERG